MEIDQTELDEFCQLMEMPEHGLSGQVYKNWMTFISSEIGKLAEIGDVTELEQECDRFVTDVKAYADEQFFSAEYREVSDPKIKFSAEQARNLSLKQTEYESRAEFYRQFIIPLFSASKKAFMVPIPARAGWQRSLVSLMMNVFFGKSMRKAGLLYNALDSLEEHFSQQLSERSALEAA